MAVGTSILSKVKNFFADLRGENRFDNLDFSILKTLMMLAAVDGDVSKDEMDTFRGMAEKCHGYNEKSFAALWDGAMRSAGYLLLQSRLLDKDELVNVFVAETEKDFVEEVALELSKERQRAFECLKSMACADGTYSEIERACITALSKRVNEVRETAIEERYSRVTTYGRPSGLGAVN